MKIIPFDIKLRNQIQSEENRYKGRYKVQTKDGIPVRIICWDKKDTKFPIITLAEDSSHSYEAIYTFRSDGKYNPNGVESGADLYLIDTWEPKFKVGDKVKYKCTTSIYTITAIGKTGYILSNGDFIPFKNEDLFEPKLTEFEKALTTYLNNLESGLDKIGDIKKIASDLFALAKKEIIEKLKEE